VIPFAVKCSRCHTYVDLRFRVHDLGLPLVEDLEFAVDLIYTALHEKGEVLGEDGNWKDEEFVCATCAATE